MLAVIELAFLELNGLAPEFALLFGVPDLRPFRRRLTVRARRRIEVMVL
jgi:hypothetical protein